MIDPKKKQGLLEAFEAIAIYDRLDSFYDADIDQYYDDDALFSLVIKRSSNRTALYGHCHVRVRQQFFNTIDEDQRISLFFRKLCAAGIDGWVLDQLQCRVSDVNAIKDIGMGRSIYHITLTNGQQYVVKEKTNDAQKQFNETAQALKIPAPTSWFTKKNGPLFELTPFLDTDNVFHEKKEWLLDIYAASAAIGDTLGLGDRHFENYMLHQKQLVPIDVSHLGEQQNELWTKTYISGGLYECCLLQYSMGSVSQFEQAVGRFFDVYAQSVYQLFEQMAQHVAQPLIQQAMVRWKQPCAVIQRMTNLMAVSLCDMMDRLVYKQLLMQLADRLDLSRYPTLRMYQLADENRLSTFFRVEEERGAVFDTIRSLSDQWLGVTPQYFMDRERGLVDYKQAVVNATKVTRVF